MTEEESPAFFDANTLISFAVVDRLDILRTAFDTAAAWTEQVRREVRTRATFDRRVERVEAAGWLGEPETFDELTDVLQIEQLRLAITGARKPNRTNLGEAQTIFAIEQRHPDATFVSDDRHAADLAYRRGITVLDTCELLSDCHSRRIVGRPEAYELLRTMAANNRFVRVPGDHRGVC